MATKIDVTLENLALAAMKTALDGGTLYLFAGPVPNTPDAALDMSSAHTQVVALKNGSNGVTFGAPDNGILGKTADEVWSGTITLTGADTSATSVTPTFYRICPAGDNGQAASTTSKRVQGAVGGPNSGAEIQLSAAALTPGDTFTLGAYYIGLGS